MQTPIPENMILACGASFEEALLKWYSKQIPVRSVGLKSKAIKLANHMNTPFKASDGWLWLFAKGTKL